MTMPPTACSGVMTSPSNSALPMVVSGGSRFIRSAVRNGPIRTVEANTPRMPAVSMPVADADTRVLASALVLTVLRFDPWVPAGRVHVAPVLPEGVGRLRIDDIPLLGGRISVAVERDGSVEVGDVPPGIQVVATPRSPIGGGRLAGG